MLKFIITLNELLNRAATLQRTEKKYNTSVIIQFPFSGESNHYRFAFKYSLRELLNYTITTGS